MDDLDAPTWADFIAPSPQISVDDYFLHKHEDHEYRNKLDLIDSDSLNISTKSLNISKQHLNETTLANESINIKTPVRKICSKESKSSSLRKSKLKETTYENVLMEAMNNLQLSIKKGEKSFNKSCLIDSPAFQTPLKRVTRSMCAQINASKSDLDESHYVSLSNEKSVKDNEHEHCDHDHSDVNKENINTEASESEHESPTNVQTSQINLEVTASSTEHEISHEKLEPEPEVKPEPNKQMECNEVDNTEIKQLPKSRIVTSFNIQETTSGNGSKKKLAALTGNAWHRQLKRRMSITNQRRLSISKAHVASKYVSMAEAVTKFHRTTPQRFHTATVKTTRTEQLRRMSFKLTRATSPALICKNRSRPVTAISREEQEQLELERIRQNQIKANPVRKDILRKPAPLKKVEKKILTNPEPFHLTVTKKGQPPPKQMQEIKPIQRVHKKTVPAIVSTDEKGIIVKDEEVLHFGIPLDKSKKKNTKVMPFSFEARNRQLQLKKQEKLKKLQEMEQQLIKAEFHARPVPAAVKTPLKLSQKDNSINKSKNTLTRSVSFEDRVKLAQKKKEENLKQLFEEERKTRNFKAQKVPEFKPVLIRGRSRDNLLKKSQENLTKPQTFIKRPISIPFVAPRKNSTQSVNADQENQNQGAIPKILEPKCKVSQKSIAVLTELNTDKRAKQRKEFDEQLKKKEHEEEEMRRKEQEEKIVKEKVQKQELRKKTEIKARPMPVYKAMNIAKSNKPLTEAQSPAWAKRKLN